MIWGSQRKSTFGNVWRQFWLLHGGRGATDILYLVETRDAAKYHLYVALVTLAATKALICGFEFVWFLLLEPKASYSLLFLSLTPTTPCNISEGSCNHSQHILLLSLGLHSPQISLLYGSMWPWPEASAAPAPGNPVSEAKAKRGERGRTNQPRVSSPPLPFLETF